MDPVEQQAFLFTDVEGSTRAATALGSSFAGALDTHRRIVRAAINGYGGREVSTAGDSFFAVFPDPAAAVAAAIEIQRNTEATPASSRLRARIGLHAGQALRVGDDYVGIDVHRAARISDAGHGGQILISDETVRLLDGRLPAGVALVDLGRHRLKDVGPERLWKVIGDGVPTGPFPPPRSLEAHPSNLPAETNDFVDRTREREELGSLVRQVPLVSLTGPGGIGKTRLAIAVARSLIEHFGDGVFHVDVALAPDAGHVVPALIERIGLRVGPDEDPLPALLDRLRNRDVLIVLDTADRVAGLPDLVAAIASACPRVRVLVTSRSPLHLAAEREYPVGALPASAAVELYAVRAEAIRPGFSLDGRTRAAVQQVVERLDRIPLAVELAAARARLLSPAALLDRLERRLPALGEASRDAPDRQRTLQATIAWSCELLTPSERGVFEQLGVFEGSFDLEALEAILDVPAGEDIPTIVEALVDRSLVVVDLEAAEGPRFRLLGPMREFAAEALASSGGEPAARERHAAYWAELTTRESANLDGDHGLEAIARIGRDEPNIHRALEWLMERELGTAAALIVGLSRYWRLRGRVTEGLAWLDRAAAVSSVLSPAVRASLLFWKGALEDDARRPEDAARSLNAALALRRELGDERGIARALNSLGVVTRSLGKLDEAERMLQESMERAAAIGDRRAVAMALSNQAIVAEDREDHHAAADYATRALDIDRELGGAYVIVGTANLAVTLVRAGRIDEGLARLREALPGIRELDDPDLVIEVLAALAEAALAGGRPEDAARLGLAATALAAVERRPLHPSDRAKVETLVERAAASLSGETLASLRGQAATVDLQAGLALAAKELGAAIPGATAW
jgi:predicted ATPase/class 3 adenylate cyclase